VFQAWKHKALASKISGFHWYQTRSCTHAGELELEDLEKKNQTGTGELLSCWLSAVSVCVVGSACARSSRVADVVVVAHSAPAGSCCCEILVGCVGALAKDEIDKIDPYLKVQHKINLF
jgi:hypothetical protein